MWMLPDLDWYHVLVTQRYGFIMSATVNWLNLPSPTPVAIACRLVSQYTPELRSIVFLVSSPCALSLHTPDANQES